MVQLNQYAPNSKEILIAFRKPLHRQKLACNQITMPFPAGISQIDPDLRVGRLAGRTAELAGNIDRAIAPFNQPRLIYQQHPVRLA